MNGLARVVKQSGNKKTGSAVVTYAAQQSCPGDCPFLGAGCYAEGGLTYMSATRHLNANAEGVDALAVAFDEARQIDELKVRIGQPMRLHTVGDCATDEAAEIVAGAAERYMARGGGKVWTYTHAWRTVARESWGTVAVLASCENEEDVLDAHARGYATALVVPAFRDDKRHAVGAVDMVPCPAQTRGRTCTSCRLCFDDERLFESQLTIGFAVHGGTPTHMAQALQTLVRQEAKVPA